MWSLKSNYHLAILICFLLYLTCYGRFFGQLYLTLIQLITAFSLTITIYKGNIQNLKSKIKLFWTIIIPNIILVFSLKIILHTDPLQFIFITLLPNIMTFYLYGILLKVEKITKK